MPEAQHWSQAFSIPYFNSLTFGLVDISTSLQKGTYAYEMNQWLAIPFHGSSPLFFESHVPCYPVVALASII